MWNIIFCDEWDFDLGEPARGGRCLEECATASEARAAAQAWAGRIAYWRARPVLARLAGWLGHTFASSFTAGEVILTGPDHSYVASFPVTELAKAA